MTVGILVVSHGTLAGHLVSAAEMIAGRQEDIVSAGLEPHMGLEDFTGILRKASDKLGSDVDGILVLADLQGGTPCNAANMLTRSHTVRVVCGANLPMLLEVLMSRNCQSLDELVETATKAGKEGVKELTLCFNTKRVSGEDDGEMG
jgi:PTS system mannose-specific IIA component